LDSGGGDSYSLWNRVYFVPDAKLIAVLSQSKDQVVLYKFDPEEGRFAKADFDYLFVTSEPPVAKSRESVHLPHHGGKRRTRTR